MDLQPLYEVQERLEHAAIAGTGKFAVKTPDVDIRVNPDRLDLVETRLVEGRKCLVIAVEDNIEVNGVPVTIWADKNGH